MAIKVRTINKAKKDMYFDRIGGEEEHLSNAIERLKSEVRFVGIPSTHVPQKAKREVVIEPKVQPKFDPFSIHTINVFKLEGADGLRNRLAGIENIANLKELISAQRIPVGKIDDTIQPAELRELVVQGVEKRISARRAAND